MTRDPLVILRAQAAYFIATGILPFVSRRAFEAATGRKREWWLVQTVGVLVTAVGGTLLATARRPEPVPPETLGLAAGSAAGLAAIDIVYVARRRISANYLLDASVQIALLVGLARAVRRS